MKLSNILSAFETVKSDLTTFVKEQTATNEKLQTELAVGEADVGRANKALKQIKKITG